MSNIPPPCLSIQQRDNPRGLSLCPNKLIPQLTRQSKVQGRMQIPEGLIEFTAISWQPTLAVNQLIVLTVCLGDAASSFL